MVRKLGTAIAAFLLLLLEATSGSVRAATPDEAARFVDTLGRRAFGMLNQQGLPLEHKEAQVRALLAENFDLKLIGRFVLGAAWRTMGEEQRETYLGLFEEYVLRTYSKRLGGYSGQQFAISGAKAVGADDALVATTISRPGAPPIEAGWRVRTNAQPYKIVDVIVAGVSMVVTQRSEFGAVVQRQGVDGLIEILRLQISKFPAQAN